MKKVAILYSELAEYSLACFKALTDRDVSLLLIHWPINPEAPFKFDLSFCQSYSKDSLDKQELVNLVAKFSPDLILTSGWMDKDYVGICKKYFGKIPTVLTLDNHWTGSIKQRIACAISPFTLLRTFSNAFVPGLVQVNYALKLGFHADQIQIGFYCADTHKFSKYYHIIQSERKSMPKRFLYVGRYVEHKGIFDLWQAFERFRVENPDWELWCVGTGDQFDQRMESNGIKHFGFVQPSDLMPIMSQCSIYILPSHFEPWGVSAHEMAVAGFPMILSDAIGSKEAFLRNGKNGFEFKSGSVEQLIERMQHMANLESEVMVEMTSNSVKLGLSNTPNLWVQRLLNFLPGQ